MLTEYSQSRVTKTISEIHETTSRSVNLGRSKVRMDLATHVTRRLTFLQFSPS